MVKKKAVPLHRFWRQHGQLAQLVQSICLTSRGSGVRIPHCPPHESCTMCRTFFVIFRYSRSSRDKLCEKRWVIGKICVALERNYQAYRDSLGFNVQIIMVLTTSLIAFFQLLNISYINPYLSSNMAWNIWQWWFFNPNFASSKQRLTTILKLKNYDKLYNPQPGQRPEQAERNSEHQQAPIR